MVQELVPLLFVDDIARSAEFYQRKLGFAIVQTWEPEGNLGWCRLERDRAAIMLQQACDADGPPAGRGRGVAFYFNCDDVNSLHCEFCASGLNTASPKLAFYGMNQVFITDPDGYGLCFQSSAS